MALVMKVVLGWDMNFSIIVSSLAVARVCGAGRPALGHLQRGAAVRADLGRRAAGADPGPDRGRRLGGFKARLAQHRCAAPFPGGDYTHMWRSMGHFADNPMGIHWTGIVFGLGFAISFGYWTTDFLVVQRVLAANRPALGAHGSGHRLVLQDGGAVHRHSARPAGPGGAAESDGSLMQLWRESSPRPGGRCTATTRCCR
jgi:hypothetical protein